MKLNILHIAVHFGGGAGTVLNNWFEYDINNNHMAILLNNNYYGGKKSNIYENLRNKYDEINKFVAWADIVIVHFWNHPLLFEFLINANLPKSRLCIWSHVSGLHPPYVHTENLLNFPDRFIFSSPVSGKKVIWTTGGVGQYLQTEKRIIDGQFRIGYVGTLDYSKLHPDFVEICSEIYKKIPKAKFIICGSGGDELKVRAQIAALKMERVFEFTGFINNVKDVMATFSVFGYPLNEKHFGTCEQVLGEAMACGVEPVVLNNPSEKYIVDGYGRVCHSTEDYINNIVDIYENTTDKKTELKGRAVELYDMTKMTNMWGNEFSAMMEKEKSDRQWPGPKCMFGFEIFIESIGKYGDILKYGNKKDIKELFDLGQQWRSKSKGSVQQYLAAFPGDSKLQEWASI